MCIISCILGHLSWSDGSCLVNFNLDVDLECNLERILKGLLHWQWIAGGAGFFVGMYLGDGGSGRFYMLIQHGGHSPAASLGDAPMNLRDRALRNSGRVPLSLQKNAKGGEQGAQLACGSNKCPLPSNAFSCEPRGSQLPPSRRHAPGGSSTLGVGGS